MKKIYMILAAITLLSLSLNAQTKKAYRHNTTTQFSAPAMGPSRASTTPVTPPYTNDFGSNTLFNWWEVIDANSDSRTWTRNNSGYAQYQYHTTNYADDWLVTAPLTLEVGKAYTFSIDAWCRSGSYPEGIEVLLSDGHTSTSLENGVVLIQPTLIASTSSTTLTKSFGVAQSGNYYIGIHAISDADMYYLYVDNFSITVMDNPPHDLSVELAAPTSVYAGETVTVTARVFNSEIVPEKNYTVNITANGNVIHTETVTNSLAAGTYATYTAQYATTQAQGGQTVNFGVQLVFNDDDATNNTATAQTAINILPPPQNVAATSVNNSGTMTWNAPTITASAVTESFENFGVFPAFQTGGITASAHTGAYGEWSLYDSSGGYNYGLSGHSWPNSSGPASFYPIAYDLTDPAWTDGAAHTGAQFMLSTVPTSGNATDHWLISPELSGEAQTITFWVREITTQYGAETYEVLTSSTNNNYSSFSIVGSTRQCSSTTWTQVSVTLPAGSKYFAIHHTSVDIFGLMIDDITYIPAQVMPVSYNIYLDGQLVGNVPANTFSYTFNNLPDGEYECSVSAVYALGESAAVPATFTINTQQDQTDAPVITVSEPDANGNVTVTATGDGTVTLTIDGQTVTGQGSASITLPQHMQTYTVTASATAQAAGELVSPTTTQQVTVPGRDPNGEWTEMDGTYDDPNTLLSFLKDGEDIMLLDQFVESTLNNEQPAGYIYTLKEDQNGETKTSTPVPIPVYKTSSTMQGFYTYNQIKDDIDMHLKPQVINSKMTYDVAPDGNTLYYNLYRGNVGEDYPVIDDAHRVSKLQAFEENSQFFLFESHTSGVTPRYDHVGNSIVERLDTNYVQGVEGDEISYVPVIWTLGINSARGDGKDNSYGSDIKRETLGAVEPYSIEIERSNGSAWGKWKVPGTNQEYCVYIPTVTINGTVPAMMIANDGDKSTYVPFMYRAWVTYPAARAFSTDSETGSLIDLGPMELPHLLGTEYSESAQAVITDKWDPGDGVLQCSFGGPADEYVNYDDVTFVVRLYYKKVVTEGDNTGSRLGDDPDDAEEYYIVQGEGSATDIETALREMFGAGAVPVSVTYVNAQGMQSSKPFDGLNIVVTRYSDGSTTTSKMVR